MSSLIAKGAGAPGRRRRWRPRVEELEGRQMMAADPGYVVSGLKWAAPGRITFSFPSDGVEWDGGTNALNAAFNSKFGAGAWQGEIARALQTWASVANLNVVEVPDRALNFDVPGVEQGDARFGDIRIGGYAFNNTTTLAQTYFPPPGGYTAAGDSDINLAANYSIGGGGGTYDLYSVMLHELGHSLGMEHAAEPDEVMYGVYQGVRAGLSAGDIAGIQSIYGARTPDSYQSQGLATSTAAAVDLTAGLDGWGRETVNGTSLFRVGDTEYFRVVAPASATAFWATAAAGNLSLLSPQVSILDAGLHPLDTAGNASAYGDDVTATAGTVVPGRTYYVAVTGATRDVFATGAYQLRIAFAGVSPPPAPAPDPVPVPVPVPAPTPITTPPVVTAPAAPTAPPVTPVVNTPAPTTPPAVAPDRYQANNRLGAAVSLGTVVSTQVTGLTVSSATAAEFFAFRAGRRGVFRVSAPGAQIRVYDSSGRQIGSGTGTLQFTATRVGGTYTVSVSSPDGSLVASTSLGIGPAVVARVVPGAQALALARAQALARTQALAAARALAQARLLARRR